MRWLRLTALLAGDVPGRLHLDEARDLAGFLVATGRQVPADRWVDELIAARESRSLDSFGAC